MARKALKNKNKAKFAKVSDAEQKAIKIEQEEEGLSPEKTKVIRRYLQKLIRYAGLKSELDDIGYTIQYMKENKMEVWKANDQFISLGTFKARLEDCYYRLRVFEIDLYTTKRQVFEAYEITQKEIDELYAKLMGTNEKVSNEKSEK